MQYSYWPSPTNDQKEKIRKTAQAILNARALYTDSNLADLYDPLTMPTELLKAHNGHCLWDFCKYTAPKRYGNTARQQPKMTIF